jgi:hypothetical protein
LAQGWNAEMKQKATTPQLRKGQKPLLTDACELHPVGIDTVSGRLWWGAEFC